MHDYLLSTEVVRFAFMLGVAVSMLLYEKRHLTTGSIVVPGYIATFILYPLVVAATFVNALISYVIVNRVLRRWFLLYGRTKFTVLALISILIQTAMLKLTPSGPWLWESDFKLFVGVGYVVPALIAHDMGRQGVGRTIKSVLYAATLVVIPIALALVFDLPGINDLAPLEGFGDMAIDTAWLPFSILLSAAAAWGVATNYGMRCGGFVGAAFIGMFMGDPWQVLVAGAIAMSTYLIVSKLLMNHMILFGRRKFSAMLLVASSLSWLLLWSGREFFGPEAQRHLDLGSLALAPLFLPGLIANDAQRTSPRKVLLGFAMASTFVVTVTWWVQSLFEGLALALVWKIVAVGAFVAIFWRQLVPVRGRETAGAPSPAPIAAAGHVAAHVAAQVVTIGPAVTLAFGMGGYRRWAAAHPAAAHAADRWLSAVIGESAPPLPAIALPAPATVERSHGHELGAPIIQRLKSSAIAARSSAPTATLPRATVKLPVRHRPVDDPHCSSEQDPFGVDQVLAR
ncbi:MAG: poly-gamma-glutamate biosynthesis protein PgsC/CapC [Ilumatobacteraceae bacterium]